MSEERAYAKRTRKESGDKPFDPFTIESGKIEHPHAGTVRKISWLLKWSLKNRVEGKSRFPKSFDPVEPGRTKGIQVARGAI